MDEQVEKVVTPPRIKMLIGEEIVKACDELIQYAKKNDLSFADKEFTVAMVSGVKVVAYLVYDETPGEENVEEQEVEDEA